jgi:hypothetical protein
MQFGTEFVIKPDAKTKTIKVRIIFGYPSDFFGFLKISLYISNRRVAHHFRPDVRKLDGVIPIGVMALTDGSDFLLRKFNN